MKPSPFSYTRVETADEAVAELREHGDEAKLLAGGQSLMPMLAFRLVAPTLLVDLRKLPDLRDIKISDDGVRLGAMVRWREPRSAHTHANRSSVSSTWRMGRAWF